jgi:hypothetical protein
MSRAAKQGGWDGVITLPWELTGLRSFSKFCAIVLPNRDVPVPIFPSAVLSSFSLMRILFRFQMQVLGTSCVFLGF